MAYELVIFDLGGVAVEFDSDRLIHQVSQLIGRSFEDVHAAVYHEELLLPFELGRIEPQEYYEGLKKKLSLPWTYDQFVRAWNNIFSENHDVTQLIQRLRKGHKLTALTNTNALHIAHIKATILSLSLFDDWVASCDVCLRKPDPAIYQLAVQRVGVRPEAAVYVDDRPELVEAGRGTGLMAIRFENTQQLERDLRAIGFKI